MASTYSTSLKLTLIGDGDQTGTWGQTTNANFGTLLEQAIVGQTTITMANADYTLTNLNGALDEARGAVLIITGNQNATFSVIVPAVPKLYIVTNNLSGSAIAYIKPSGGNTFQVPYSRTMYLYTNGTTFYALDYVTNAQNLVTGGTITTGAINCSSLTSSGAVSGTTITASTQFSGPGTGISGTAAGLSVGGTSLNVTGIVAVVNGGSGVTTSTGTGNNVLSTSPTLVTPLLGTPTSGVMTNVTGLPLTTGVTGTLPVGNGGTGATTLTSNGVVYGNGTSAVGITAAGTTGQVLIATTSGAPSWGSVPSTAAVTSITFGSTGLTPSTATTGVVTVAGTLAVANGGTGVTTSTGSGNVVLSTSPTLVTPILGTPQSGNLANCTFPTLNQNTTGNAATATLATNATNAAGLTGTPDITVGTITSGLQTITTPTVPSNGLIMLGYGLTVTGTLNSILLTSIHSPLGIRNTSSSFSIYTGYGGTTYQYGFQTGIISADRFSSTVATGTAPFTVTSTTPVANLSIGGNAATATTATTATNLSGGTVAATTITATSTITSDNRVIGTSPNSGNSGAITLKDAAGDPNAVYLQATNNSASTQYASLKFNSNNTITPSGNIVGDITGNISGNALTATNTIGNAQTWQNMSASRSISTNYNNATGKPIQVKIYVVKSGGNNVNVDLSLFTDGGLTDYQGIYVSNGGNWAISVSVIVPIGGNYSAAWTNPDTVVWWELR